MSEFFDLDRPDGDDKRPKHVYNADAAGWRIAAGKDMQAGLHMRIDHDHWNGVITLERRIELAGYPEESE